MMRSKACAEECKKIKKRKNRTLYNQDPIAPKNGYVASFPKGEILSLKRIEITIILLRWVKVPHCYFFTQAGVRIGK